MDVLRPGPHAWLKMKVLVVEDSARLRDAMGGGLAKLGHAVDFAADGAEASVMGRHPGYDVIVLDRMLPDKEGLEVLREWRASGIDTPVLLLTALDGVEEKVRGLGVGADDYLTKPFALAELVARLEALVRRRYAQADPRIRIGPLEIDTASRQVAVSGTPVVLTAREYTLLECLARRPGHVLSRAQIEERLYAETDGPLSNAVDAAVYSLRRKLDQAGAPPLVHTRRGLGYTLAPA